MGCFSLILFSQIIDNIRSVRSLFLVIEFFISLSLLSFGSQLVGNADFGEKSINDSSRFTLIFISSVYSLIQVI